MATQVIQLDRKHFVEEVQVVVFSDGDAFYALDTKSKAIIVQGTNASEVIQKAVNAVSGTGGVIFVRDINPGSFTLSSVPTNVLVLISYNGTITLLKPDVNVILNNFGYRSFETIGRGNTLRLRDNTDPNNMIDLYAIDPTTGDIHFFVNTSVDNMNLAGFLGKNNLPPGRRWLNKNCSPVKVFDICFLDNNILSFRTGDPTIDNQPVIDRFGLHTDGRMFRVNMPPPTWVSPIPTTPWRVDDVGACILYFVVDLAPTANADAVATFDISPDNVTWFNAIAKIGVAMGGPRMTQTIVLYVPSGWYVRWTLSNASIVTLFKQYL
jgi:hypothetical protein